MEEARQQEARSLREAREDLKLKRVHATDGPLWWCPGVFSMLPSHYVGVPGERWNYPVHVCETCGEQLFIAHAQDPGIPAWDDMEARRLELLNGSSAPGTGASSGVSDG